MPAASFCPPCSRSFWVAALSLAVLAGEVRPALATSPSLKSITPAGGRRGTDVEVVVAGSRLKDMQDLFFYEPGIELKKVTPLNSSSAKVQLTISPDCRLGIHGVRVRSATGISDLALFSVGALVEAAEVEPNNDFAVPQKISIDSTINGVVQNEDVDFYLVEAKKGERIIAEVEGIRLGRANFDPYVSILDRDRFELTSSDDAALLWRDGVASLVAPEDGSYVVQVRDSSFQGGGATYRLHVGHYPRPQAIIPAGGRPGETIDVHWLGDIAGETVTKVKVPSNDLPYSAIFQPDTKAIGLFAQNKDGISPTPNYFRISDLGNVIETEPNNDRATATPFSAPMAVNGAISTDGDVDCYKFRAKKGDRYDVRVHGRSIRSPLDSVLKIERIGGNAVGSNDDSGSPDSYLRFTAPADDEYVITVSDLLKQGGAEYAYRVEVSPLAPVLEMALPERQRYQDTITAVPQGNRLAFLISATRRDFAGELAVDIQNLPKGLTLEAMPIAANQTMVPVLLSAAADAPLSGTLADVVGRVTDPKQNVVGHLSQTTMLVQGDNQRPVWTYTAERMATAVTEKSPFSIEIIEPRVPIVRNGSMELRIKATREKDFKAPINIRFLYNPPGIGSSAAASIPEGKDEGTIPVTANAGAELGAWKIAVLGEASVDGGTVLVSSQLAKLEVAEAFFQLAFKPVAAEQGKDAELPITITQNSDFPGKAKLELVGLPGEVTSEATEISKDASEANFKIKTSPKSPAGRHKAIMCRATVTVNGEPVVYTLGPAELRIDAPLPPKTKAKPTTAAKPAAVAAAKPAQKTLSRLEQLRQEREGDKTSAEPAKPAANK